MQASSNEVILALQNDDDLAAFAMALRYAVIERVAARERFSAMRLRTGKFTVSNAMSHFLGRASEGSFTLNPMQMGRAPLDTAEVVIHEMAHNLAGEGNWHNDNWREAAIFLGLVDPRATHASPATPEMFDSGMLAVINDAIARFARENPRLVATPDAEIPWPDGVGTYLCERDHESFHPCYNDDGSVYHRAHILKFQLDGIREMLRRPGNILLADVMGLGKTVQAMGFINATKPKRIFIGCPNNAKLIWLRHFQEFCTEPYDVEVAYTQLYMLSDVVIMNYEAMVRWEPMLDARNDDLVIFDEGHYLKTPSAKRSKVAYKRRAAKKIIITGTPIVNYPYELFPLAHYLDPDEFYEYSEFEASYGSKSGDKLGRNLNRLNDRLRRTIMTRREKSEVEVQFPKKRRQVVEFEVPPEVKALIDRENMLFDTLKGNTSADDFEAAKLWNTLRNESDIANDDIDFMAIIEELKLTKKFAFEEMARMAHDIGLAKLPFVIEHIEQMIDAREKVLVFAHHRDVMKKLADKFGQSALLLMGGNRDQALATKQFEERFNNDDSITVGIAQISNAAGYSIKGTSTVLFIEEDWVPGVMTQAEDRCHGLGRGEEGAKSMLIQHLVFQDSLDTKKAKLTIRKQKSIDRAVGARRPA